MSKNKFDTTPAKFEGERSEYPQGFYPNGEWAGFFCGENAEEREKVVTEWCKREEGRTFNWIARPKPEPRVGVATKVKRTVAKFKPSQTAPKSKSKTKVKKEEPQNLDWEVEDINDDEKMTEVAEKSQTEAIKKLKSK